MRILNYTSIPVDINIEIPTAQLPGTLLLRENTIERGGNSTTFSISDFTEQIRITGVNTPPSPPRYPDYLVNRGDIRQWLSIRSNTFGNQENVRLNLTFHYDPEKLGGINPESLSVWQYNNTRWHNGSVEYPWNGTRWLDTTTHEVGVQILSMPPWNAGTVIYAPLGSMPVRNLNLEREYEMITEALTDYDLRDGHTITVDSGYVGTENLRIFNSDITLVAASGLHSDVRVIAEDQSKPAIEVRADGVIISGFVLEGATSSYGLHFHGTKNSRIEKSTLTSNGQGVFFEDYSGIASPATTRNCTVADSIITGNTQGGVVVLKTHQNIIQDCTISDPEYGVGIQEGEENTLSGNTFTDNPKLGIWILRSDGTGISEHIIIGGETGIFLDQSTETTLAGINVTEAVTAFRFKTAEDTAITGSRVSGYTTGFFLDEAERTEITDCHLSNAKPDAASTGIRVRSSKDTAITRSSVSGINSMNFGATGVELFGNTRQTTITDMSISDIQTPQATGVRVGAGAMNTWIDNITATNFSAGQGGASGIFLAHGSGISTIQRGTIDEIRSAGLSTAVVADRAAGVVIRKLDIDRINSTAGTSSAISINDTNQVAIQETIITRISGDAQTSAVSLDNVAGAALGYLTVGDTHPVLFNMTATGSLSVSGVETPPAPPEGRPAIGRFLEIRNTTPSEAAIRIYYTEGDTIGVDPSTLRIWRHTDEWSRVFGEDGVDTANRFVYATTNEFSVFAPLAEPLRADFTAEPLRGVAPLPVQFTDRSEGGPTAWSWTFGDGGTNASQHPYHIYQAPGNYTVTLRVTKGDGSSTETKEEYITVLEPLAANFTANVTAGSPPLTVQFTDRSTGNPERWFWEFGDGTNSTLRHPSRTYTLPGLYDVNLIIAHDDGTATLHRAGYIRVYGPPEIAGITPAFGYRNGLPVHATITGNEFREGAAVILTGTPDIVGTDVTVVSETEITCRFTMADASIGIRGLRVANTDGQFGSADALFMIRPRGDFNGNGRVDIGDVARVAWMAVGLTTEDPEARFSGEDRVTGADAARIAYFYVGQTQAI